MNPVQFCGCNAVFSHPSDLDESQCMAVPGYVGRVEGGNLDGAPIVVVAWKPNEAEVAAINKGSPVFLHILGQLPAHFLATEFVTKL